MKKKIVLILVCVLVPAYVFAGISAGFQYGNNWEKADKTEGKYSAWVGSPGMFINGNFFLNKKNIGFFIGNSLLFPKHSSVTTNGITVKNGTKDWDFRLLYQFSIGPAFRYPFLNKFALHVGTGLNISVLVLSADKTVIDPVTLKRARVEIKSRAVSIGVAADIGVKYDFTDTVYVDLGTKIGVDFAGHTKITSNIPLFNASKWNSSYIGFQLSPYIGLGLNLPF